MFSISTLGLWDITDQYHILNTYVLNVCVSAEIMTDKTIMFKILTFFISLSVSLF